MKDEEVLSQETLLFNKPHGGRIQIGEMRPGQYRCSQHEYDGPSLTVSKTVHGDFKKSSRSECWDGAF